MYYKLFIFLIELKILKKKMYFIRDSLSDKYSSIDLS